MQLAQIRVKTALKSGFYLLDIAEKNWKIDARDRMSLLVACCKDCIGAVGVEPIINEEE